MKAFCAILVISIILLSLYLAESHFVKPWHLCKTKEVTDPPTPCNALECSGLCGSMYTGGIGICIAESCECLHSCFKEGPPHSVDDAKHAMPLSIDDVKTPQRLESASSSMKRDLKNNENVSKMVSSSSSDHDDDEVVEKNERVSKAVLASNSMDVKRGSSKVATSFSKKTTQVWPDRFSENVAVAITSQVVPAVNKPDRIFDLGLSIQP